MSFTGSPLVAHAASYFAGAAYTGIQWKCLPVPTDPDGKPVIHYTTVYKVFAKWADDGSLWQAFVASVQHLAAEKHLVVYPHDADKYCRRTIDYYRTKKVSKREFS